MLVVPAMAAVTEHLGFGVTFSTSYEPPFTFARRMSTLDHLTAGRIGWNIVTSYLPNAARNFGLLDEIPHDTRFAIAEEYLDVLYKLWEGSWDDDAVVRDAERGSTPTRTRSGTSTTSVSTSGSPDRTCPSRRRSAPRCCSRPPPPRPASRRPRATPRSCSPAPARVASRRSSSASAAPRRPSAAHRTTSRSSSRPRSSSDAPTPRSPASSSSTAATPASSARYVHAGPPVRPDRAPRARHGRGGAAPRGRAGERGLGRSPSLQTLAEFAERTATGLEREFFAAGTPTAVADEIERWLDEVGIDGINLRQYHSFDTARDFVDLVVPELRRRGRLRESYVARRDAAPPHHRRGRPAARHPSRGRVPRRTRPGVTDPGSAVRAGRRGCAMTLTSSLPPRRPPPASASRSASTPSASTSPPFWRRSPAGRASAKGAASCRSRRSACWPQPASAPCGCRLRTAARASPCTS